MGNVNIFVGDMTQEQAKRLGPAINEVQNRLALKIKTGKCSFGFIVDLAKHLVMNTLDVSAIYDEVSVLEHPEAKTVGTKGVQRFKHEPLFGLSYKHYFSTTSLLKNLQNELYHGRTIENFFRERYGELSEKIISELTHEIVVKNFERRSLDGRLTGEWIIFEETDASNYYLTLGGHAEGDENIHTRILHYRAVDTEIIQGSENHQTQNINYDVSPFES